MSPPSLHAMSTIAAHIRPTPGSFSPSAARMNTVITNALEIGLLSEMPSEMPFTSTNRKHSTTATTRNNTGWCSTWLPTMTSPAPQNTTHSTSRVIHPLPILVRSPLRPVLPPATDRLDQDHADVHDGRAEDRAQRDDEPDLAERRARLQPADASRYGFTTSPMNPTTSAGMAMRAPTIIPAPKVEVDTPSAPPPRPSTSQPAEVAAQHAAAELGDGTPEERPVGQRAQNVRHREPDGNDSCILSTRIGV